MNSFENAVKNIILDDNIVFPSQRNKCVRKLSESMDLKKAVALEKEAALTSQLYFSEYIPIIQHLDESGVEEALKKISNIHTIQTSKEKEIIDEINSMEFVCTVSESKYGGKKCPKCNSNNLIAEGRQTRSADEGQTVFYACKNCSYQFR